MRLAVLIAVVVLCVPFTAAANTSRVPAHKQAWQYRYQVWMPAHWQRLAECESGSKPPNWKHDSGTYQSAFGFHYGSWDQFKYPGYPDNGAHATPWQQFHTARRIAARYGIAEPWGCWRGPHHAWVRGGLPEYGTYR